MPHFSHKRSHIFFKCFGHLVVGPHSSSLCSVDSSKRCSPTHVLHRCKLQMSQYVYIEGTGSHKDDTVTHPGHYAVCPWSDTLKLVSVGDPG